MKRIKCKGREFSVRNPIKKILTFALCLALLAPLGGCIYLVAGGVGALGGYVISPDTVEGYIGRDSADVWAAAVEIVSIMGAIEEEDEPAGLLRARIVSTDVTVLIYSMSPTTTKMLVKARKYHLPRIRTAQDVYTKIITYMHN